nr:class I SAM-dependent methyltransferase [Candidatus Paceibacterota bacterium]
NFNYLEIGVGSGKLFNYFEKKANISFGVEPGSWVLGNSKKNIVPSIEKLPKDINFDLIIAHDVLEHLTDPIMMLSDLKKTSNEGCIISCTFPNKDSFKAKIQKEKWHMVRPLGHLHYFSKKSIRIMFEKSEWTILEIRKCRISENTSIDLIKNFKWSEKNILYRIIKSLLIGQIILGKDQWTVTAIAKTI